MLNKIKSNKGLTITFLILIVVVIVNLGSEKNLNVSELDESLASFYKKEEVSPKKFLGDNKRKQCGNKLKNKKQKRN